MPIVKNTLEENYVFFLREISRINREIYNLPKGSVSVKKIGGAAYYYHQWREGSKVKSVLLDRETTADLINKIKRRKALEAQKRQILGEIQVIVKAIDAQAATVNEILRLFSQRKINALLIGSYCLPVYKDVLNLKLPTVRTQDVDFLVPQPYKGKKADMESILSDLGFAIGFSADGSTYFTNGIFKVEFLTIEKGKGADRAVLIKDLGIHAEPLRYMQMLLDAPIHVKARDFAYSVPNPAVFAFHKILVMKSRKTASKKEKDLLQIVSILREIKARPHEFKKSHEYLQTLPLPWQRAIKEQIRKSLPDFLDVE